MAPPTTPDNPPWLGSGRAVAAALVAECLPGVTFEPPDFPREELGASLVGLELLVDRHFEPDGGIPAHYELLATVMVRGRRLAWIGLGGAGHVDLDAAAAGGLLAAARALLASSDSGHSGIDTAIGRTITRVRLQVEDGKAIARGDSGQSGYTTREWRLNDCAPGPLPEAWAHLLGCMRDLAPVPALGPRLLPRGPVDLGPAFAARAAVPLPHVQTRLLLNQRLWLRVGQDATSRLYRVDVDPGQVHEVDAAGRIVQTLELGNGTSVDLPGMSLTRRQVVLADDHLDVTIIDRAAWAFVQRD